MDDAGPEGQRQAALRVGDAEREAARQRLADNMAQGRITMEEYDDRSDAILAARTRSDLDAQFDDLPVPVPVVAPPRPAPLPARLLDGALALTSSLSLVIFFVLGFAFHAWAWAWLVFLVPGAVGGWSHERR